MRISRAFCFSSGDAFLNMRVNSVAFPEKERNDHCIGDICIQGIQDIQGIQYRIAAFCLIFIHRIHPKPVIAVNSVMYHCIPVIG